MVTESETEVAGAAPATAASNGEVVAGVTDANQIVEFIDTEVDTIKALPKESVYQNARKRALMQVRNLILPPPPKPFKEKKAKKSKKAVATDVNTGEEVAGVEGVDTAAVGDTGGA